MMTTNDMILYDMLVELDIATPQELNLCHDLVEGAWEDILNTILFLRTGCHNLTELYAAEDWEW